MGASVTCFDHRIRQTVTAAGLAWFAVFARAPASTANLGPGFDALAIALDLAVEVGVEPADRLSVSADGEGAELPTDSTHLAARVAVMVTGHDRWAITVRSEIPVGRGLGSSAALAAAAAAAAGAADPLAVATEVDGHPENAAASVLGGLIAASLVDGQAVAHRLPLDPALAFVVLVPDQPLPTVEARRALPAEVPHRDAAFNLSRMGILIAGLADRERLIAAATDDRLHQAARTTLFPEAPKLLDGLLAAGALASCWSGAGPSVLAICNGDTAPSVREAGEMILSDAGVAGRALLVRPDLRGLQVYDQPNKE